MNKNNYSGALIGCASGDTLGMPIETWPRERIMRYFGRISEPVDPIILKDKKGEIIREDEFGKVKYFFKDLKKGDVTDDTILSAALAESIVFMRGLDLNDIAIRQLKAYESRRNSEGKVSGGFGKTTTEAFKRLSEGVSPTKSGVIGGPGNAPGMKMGAVGMYMHTFGDYDNGLEMAEKIGKITHLDPRSLVSGVVQAHSVYSLLNGLRRDEFVDSIVSVCREYEKPLDERFTWHKSGNMLSRLEWISNNRNTSPESAFDKLGASSAVYQSYPFALFMFQKYWDMPVSGLLETINYGGDCDTTGAIYGTLAGAKNGINLFPKKWIDTIKVSKDLIKLGGEIYSLRK
ncbi:MAG TPA: ADP-ribosylglycohydrolase family protein [Candidatus Nanoarchaeia archaeon]|nr:ADP-ribosylglycohydrolase family protein [Candidatus Nanoarchaeia archaeon]